LDGQKSTLGSYGYAGQYEQRPASLTGGMVKVDWLDIVDMNASGEVIKFQLHTAYTEKKDNDPSGILSYFVKDNFIYITDWTSERLEFPQLTKFVVNHTANHGYSSKSIIRVEPKASGKSLVQQIRFETKLNISESDNPEKDKVTRLTSILARLEARRVKLLRGSWNMKFISEVCTFPKAKHDEAVDCLVE